VNAVELAAFDLAHHCTQRTDPHPKLDHVAAQRVGVVLVDRVEAKACVELVDVAPGMAAEHVVARAAFEEVVAFVAVELVVAEAALE